MNKAAYILQALQRKTGKKLSIELFSDGSGHVQDAIYDILYSFSDEDQFYERAKIFL